VKPTAAPAYFPYPHRTMAEVMAEEVRKQGVRRSRNDPPPRGACWGCIDRTVCPWPNDCQRCAEMAS
jgi:hypothetical protein